LGEATDDEARRSWFRAQILPLEPALLARARRLAQRGGPEPEDLVHDTFARAISTARWREIENPAAFAMRILANLALDHFRRSRIVAIEAVADLDALGLVDDRPDPQAQLLARDELRRLALVVAGLPPQCRRVFTLRKVYGLSFQEIAARLGITVSTVEKHLVKGLRICSEGLASDAAAQQRPRIGKSWRTTNEYDAKR
jgi:RNA polymerase sigma-70 factor (ECF subfamily)